MSHPKLKSHLSLKLGAAIIILLGVLVDTVWAQTGGRIVPPGPIQIRVMNNMLVSRVQGRSISLPRHEVFPESSIDEQGTEEEFYQLDRRSDRMVIIGDAQALHDTDAVISGTVHLYPMYQQQFRSRVAGLEGVEARALRLGQGGGAYDARMETVAQVPIEQSTALVFYVGGDRSQDDRGVTGAAAGGVQFSLGNISQELSLGIFGMAPDNLDVFTVIRNPGAEIAELSNGWRVAHRMAVRVFELPFGTGDLVFQSQVEISESGQTHYIGSITLSVR